MKNKRNSFKGSSKKKYIYGNFLINVHDYLTVIHFKVVYSKLVKELETNSLKHLNTTKQLYLVTYT